MITLTGSSTSDIVHKVAFPAPGDNDVIHFQDSAPAGQYSAYLVQVVAKDDAHIEFFGISTTTNKPSAAKYTVDLRKNYYVWAAAPSSNLDAWSPTNNYAILMLSDSYVLGDGAELPKTELRDARQTGGGKWPLGAGDMVLMRLKLQALINEFSGHLDPIAKADFKHRVQTLFQL